MPILVVRAKPQGRSRAGVRFTRDADTYDLTDEQAEAVYADAQLVVVEDSSVKMVEPPAVAVIEDKPAPKRK